MNPNKRYTLELGGSMLVYAGVLFSAILLIKGHPDAWWRFPIAVAPVVPVSFGITAVMRRMRAMDELQQRIQLEALAFSFMVTAVLTMTYGFLQIVGFPSLNWTWVFPLMVGLWGIGQWVAGRRYR